MKYAAVAFLCLLKLVIFPVCLNAQSSDTVYKGIEHKKLAARLLVNGSVNAIKTRPLDKDGLYLEMKADKEKHQKTDNSRKESLIFLEQEIKGQLDKELDQIFLELDLFRLEQTYCQETKHDTYQKSRALIEINLNNNFSTLFARVRKQVVEEQRAGFIRYARPESKDDLRKVEANDSGLHGELLERSKQQYDPVIYDENEGFLSNKINEIIADAKSQLVGQKRIVSNSSGGGKQDIIRSSITAAIHNDIQQYRAGLKYSYEIFPSVETLISKQSLRLTFEKFSFWLSAWKFVIPGQKIQSTIQKDIPAHRDGKQSRKTLLSEFRNEVRNKIFNGYMVGLGEKERQDLEKDLVKDPSFETRIETALEKSLTHFTAVRDQIAQEQFITHFPELANGQWRLSYEDVEERENQDKKAVNRNFVEKFIMDKFILEETVFLVEVAVGKSGKLGDNSLGNQRAIVKSFETLHRADTEKFFREISDSDLQQTNIIEFLCKKAEGEIQKEWRKDTNSENYPDLFESVKDQIRKVIKDLLPLELKRRNQIEQRRQKTLKDNENKDAILNQGKKVKPGKFQGNQTGEGKNAGPGTLGSDGNEKTSAGGAGCAGGMTPVDKFSPDIVIDIDLKPPWKWVEVQIRLQQVKKPLMEKIPYNNKNPGKIVLNEIKKFLAGGVGEIKTYIGKGIKPAGENRIFIFARVFHPGIPYGIVFYLREAVREAVASFQVKKLTVLWYDGVYFSREDFDFNKMREKSSALKIP